MTRVAAAPDDVARPDLLTDRNSDRPGAEVREPHVQVGTELDHDHNATAVVCLRRGLSLVMAGHAYATLDAFVDGFAIREAALPESGDEMTDVVDEIVTDELAEHFPALHEFAVERAMQPGYDFGAEFECGLDLILDALEERSHRD